MNFEKQIYDRLAFLYGPVTAVIVSEQLQTRLDNFRRQHPQLSRSIPPANASPKKTQF